MNKDEEEAGEEPTDRETPAESRDAADDIDGYIPATDARPANYHVLEADIDDLARRSLAGTVLASGQATAQGGDVTMASLPVAATGSGPPDPDQVTVESILRDGPDRIRTYIQAMAGNVAEAVFFDDARAMDLHWYLVQWATWRIDFGGLTGEAAERYRNRVTAPSSKPPLVSILDDAAEDATAARIRDLEERNEALERRLLSIENAARELPMLGAVDTEAMSCVPRIEHAGREIARLTAANGELTRKVEEAAILAGLASPWEQLAKDRGGELDAIEERLQTVADEAFGPHPIRSADENLTAIEQGIAAERRTNLEQRTGLLATITKLEKSLARARKKAAPPPRAKAKKKGGRS